MKKIQTRGFFVVAVIFVIACLLQQPSTKSVAESQKDLVKTFRAPVNAITHGDEAMFAASPIPMNPQQLKKSPLSQTLQYRRPRSTIRSDIEPETFRQLKGQAKAQPLAPGSMGPVGYSAVIDDSTARDKPLLGVLAPNIFTNFEGPDNLSQQSRFWNPPDGAMAAGPNHILVSVNSLLAIYNKSGNELFSSSLDDWFSSVCSACNVFDPRVIYDPIAARWVLVAVRKNSTNVSNYLLSVSQSSNPTGSWWHYSLNGVLNYPPTGENTWADFPHLGFDGIAAASGGAIYLTSNQFTFSDTFRTSALNILPKSSLYSGSSLNYWRAWGRTNADGSQAFTLSPAATYGNAGDEFLVNTKNGGNFVSLWRVNPTYPPTAVSWTLQSTKNVGAYSMPPDSNQSGGCALIATNDSRISSNSVWRNNNIYAAFTEGHNWGGGNVAAIRFIQLNTSTNGTEQNLTYGADGLNYFFPVVAADGSDNVVLTFARAGSSEFGSIRYTGRLAIDPVNILQGSAQLKAGAECVTSDRWGDYFAAAVDPVDTSKVWIFGEWAKDLPGVTADSDWGTWIGQVGFGQSTTRTLTVNSINPSSGVGITVSPNDNSGLGNGTTAFTRTYNNNTSVNLTAPVTAGSNSFQKWQQNGTDWSFNRATSLTMNASHTMTAVYSSCNAPGAFTQTAPSNGQSFASTTTTVTLSWGASANANSYDVYFGTSSNPPFVANQTGRTRTVNVAAGQTYYWKVVARVSCNSSLTSTTTIRSFSVQSCLAPGAFTQSSPSNGQSFTSATTSVSLSWGASARATSYDVYFGTSSNPPFIGNQAGTSRTVNVTSGQTYYWKIVARVSCNSALTSTTTIRSFSVQSCLAPGAFTQSLPSNGQSFSSATTSVPLSWGASARATSYDVYFGTSSNPPFIGNQAGTSRTVNVTSGQTYFWKIVARVSCNSTLTSTTTIRSFSVQSCLAPGAFTQSSPSTGQSFTSATTSVPLSWGASARATSYDVYFGTSSNPPFIGNQTGTSRTVNVTLGQTYFWKIVARVSCNSALTATTTIRSFSVQSCLAPGAFTQSSPSNGQSFTSATTSVPLSWGASARATSYDVYFGTSSNPPFIGNQAGTSRAVSVTSGQTYYWKIVARVSCNSVLILTTTIRSFSVAQSSFQLLLEQFGPVPNLASAIDAILLLRDPFPVISGANVLNQTSDKNTRVLIFLSNFQLQPGETAASVVVNLIGSNNQSFDVVAEDVRALANSPFTQVRFRLPNGLAVGTCTIRVRARGQVSNSAVIRIKA